jgi:SAM-dependent methyltransferase
MKGIEIKEMVKKRYGTIAQQGTSCCGTAGSCGTVNMGETISRKIGYTDRELKQVPEGANLGLGCGNPLAFASLKKGDVVIDLGSGAGVDCFIAANSVGAEGRVIGIDMTNEMIGKARENALKGNYSNVEFRLGEIEKLPVADKTADIVISNCVINLSTDKPRAFQEAYRVLKPGGKLMISDIVLLKELPASIKGHVEAYVGCIAGAVLKSEYIDYIKAAGFDDVMILEESSYPVEFIADDPMAGAAIQELKISAEEIQEAAQSVVSVKVSGTKPIMALQ